MQAATATPRVSSSGNERAFDRSAVLVLPAGRWPEGRQDRDPGCRQGPAPMLAQSPQACVAGLQTPTLVIQGDQGFRRPDCPGLAPHHTLKARGAPACWQCFGDGSRGVSTPDDVLPGWRECRGWLAGHGGGASSP